MVLVVEFFIFPFHIKAIINSHEYSLAIVKFLSEISHSVVQEDGQTLDFASKKRAVYRFSDAIFVWILLPWTQYLTYTQVVAISFPESTGSTVSGLVAGWNSGEMEFFSHEFMGSGCCAHA